MFGWLFISTKLGKIMSSLDNLTAVTARLKADVASRLASDALTISSLTTAGSLKDATIADLTAQLTAFQNDQATIDAAVADLTDTDVTLGVAPVPAV